MSENIEFISASNLPTTEAEEVDVLCVENGELKRKAGATLGGGGGSFVMRLSAEDFGNDEGVITANYDELAKALEAGSHVNIVFPAGVLVDDMPAISASVVMWTYAEGMGLLCACYTGNDVTPIIFTNGSYIPTI